MAAEPKDLTLLAKKKIISGTPFQEGYYWYIEWTLHNGKKMKSSSFFPDQDKAQMYLKRTL